MSLINLEPQELVLVQSEEYLSGCFSILSMSNSKLAFKIRTTNPFQYKVDPHVGFLEGSQIQKIEVSCLNEHSNFLQSQRDKFQILVAILNDEKLETSDLREYFKQLPQSSIATHYITCRTSKYPQSPLSGGLKLLNLEIVRQFQSLQESVVDYSDSNRSIDTLSLRQNDLIKLEAQLEVKIQEHKLLAAQLCDLKNKYQNLQLKDHKENKILKFPYQTVIFIICSLFTIAFILMKILV